MNATINAPRTSENRPLCCVLAAGHFEKSPAQHKLVDPLLPTGILPRTNLIQLSAVGEPSSDGTILTRRLSFPNKRVVPGPRA